MIKKNQLILFRNKIKIKKYKKRINNKKQDLTGSKDYIPICHRKNYQYLKFKFKLQPKNYQ
jgi:hypothetical protein